MKGGKTNIGLSISVQLEVTVSICWLVSLHGIDSSAQWCVEIWCPWQLKHLWSQSKHCGDQLMTSGRSHILSRFFRCLSSRRPKTQSEKKYYPQHTNWLFVVWKFSFGYFEIELLHSSCWCWTVLAQAVLKLTIPLSQFPKHCDYRPVSSLLIHFLLLKPFSNLPVRSKELHMGCRLYLLQ